MKTKILILVACSWGAYVIGEEARPRHVDPEVEKKQTENGELFPNPAGTIKKVETAADPTPAPPPPAIIKEVDDPPSGFLDKIDALTKETIVMDAKIHELKEDLLAASRQLSVYSKERKELKEEIQSLRSQLNTGPGSIFRGWVFSPQQQWVYVSPTTVPYAYSEEKGWMLYQYGTDPRRVYYFNTETWVLLDTNSKKPVEQPAKK